MIDTADVCVIGSGAGGGPVAAALAEAGYEVVLLEKGPWYEREQFLKDEVTWCRRPYFRPSLDEEPQVEEYGLGAQARAHRTTHYWNGNLVGGATVLMSGYFLRLKPHDFRALSTFGPEEGANVADWPISYDDLEPYYARIEQEVGVSGEIVELPEGVADQRSTPGLPQRPMDVHPIATHIDKMLPKAGLHPFPLPRAVLSRPRGAREACEYAGYCGSYGCTSGAKGSALEVFVPRALATKHCTMRTRAMVTRLESGADGRVTRAHWVDRFGDAHAVEARVFVVACQAIESARLLLNSPGPKHPQGLANGSGQVGRNLLFSVFGAVQGSFTRDLPEEWRNSAQPFVNRAVQDHYVMEGQDGDRRPGGTLSFLLDHPNPIVTGINTALWGAPSRGPVWGRELKQRLQRYYRDGVHVKLEAFGDFLPNEHARVRMDPYVRDRFGLPVARVNAYRHPKSHERVHALVEKGVEAVRALGAENVRTAPHVGGPSVNLVGGTCRFGSDPTTSVLDADCRAHEADNLFVSDGSFMPSGGAVPFTFTIYANALRIADRIIQQLGGAR